MHTARSSKIYLFFQDIQAHLILNTTIACCFPHPGSITCTLGAVTSPSWEPWFWSLWIENFLDNRTSWCEGGASMPYTHSPWYGVFPRAAHVFVLKVLSFHWHYDWREGARWVNLTQSERPTGTVNKVLIACLATEFLPVDICCFNSAMTLPSWLKARPLLNHLYL